jgi:TRAP-type C4-dicarboxylate transport system substrate-binding protein
MGGSPLSIAMPDCYLNLQKGVFDAMLVPAEAYVGFKLYEVAPYVTNMATVAMNHSAVLNLNTWNSFPKEVQDQIMSVSGEKAAVLYGGQVYDKAREEQMDLIAAAGSTVQEYTVPDAEIQKWIEIAGQPIWDAWVKTQIAAGVTNAQQILDDTIALSKQYAAEPSMREK